jgi:hypothetical protein
LVYRHLFQWGRLRRKVLRSLRFAHHHERTLHVSSRLAVHVRTLVAVVSDAAATAADGEAARRLAVLADSSAHKLHHENHVVQADFRCSRRNSKSLEPKPTST